VLLKGVGFIFDAASQKRKYQCLIDELEKAGFIARAGRKSFDVPDDEYSIEIVYIQPRREKLKYAEVICFEDIANLLREEPDPFGNRFAVSLETWATLEAGNR
jgi:hypothetical protein